jgi:K+-transporting ATPase ATPase A chain
MDLFDWIQIFVLIGVAAACVPFLGIYMSKVFRGQSTFLHPILLPLENFSYRLAGVHPHQEMGWKKYLKALLMFNLLGFLTLFLIQEIQQFLPFNPQHFGVVPWDLALNTAISFVTNTNWQAYSGETTLSYATQMCGLNVQNFLSAATGNAALLALIRGISRKTSETIGNFWVDLVRIVIYILIPLAFVLALILISQGVIQTLSPYVEVTTLENGRQTLPLGPVASQVAIKQLGTNGGGFFGTNSAHPFENPTPLSNALELLAIVIIPASAVYMYGLMVESKKHGWLLLLAMFLLWAGGLSISCYSEYLNNPLFNAEPLLEGKETRIGVLHSLLWSVSATTTANGSVNTMLSSLTPLAGGVAMFNIMLGELAFGGVGVGLCSMLMFVLLTIFLSGLMVGRTPEYMGKKIGKREIQWVSIAVLVPAALILVGAGLASVYAPALSGLGNQGPHGLSEILYAFSSVSGNNGSAFASLHVNTLFYNLSLGVCMLLGRFSILVPSIAIAGLLVQKKCTPVSSGMFSTDTFLFLSLLMGVILIVAALTFFPALCLGPIIEHFLMLRGQAF